MFRFNFGSAGSRSWSFDPCWTNAILWVFALFLAAMIAMAAFSTEARSGNHEEEEIPFDEAEVFFELNDTDGDLGIHARIDGEPWRLLEIEGPDDNTLLKVKASEEAREQGITELFFESAEPSFDELAPDEFFARFPEGTYEVEGVTIEGEELESETEITHLMPAPPANVTVNGAPAAEDCDADELPSAATPVVIAWDPPVLSHPDLGRTNEPITVVLQQLVAEIDDTDFVFSLHLPPTATSATIPDELVALATEGEVKFEILIREESGNQTALESCFEVAE